MQAGNSYFNTDAPAIVLKSLFKKYDSNNNGYLEESELKHLLQDDLGLSSYQSELYSLLLDKDGDHHVSFDEFQTWLRSEERFQNIDDLSRFSILCQAVNYFKMFDKDDNDTLNHDEFNELMVSLGYHDKLDKEKAFGVIDCHGNGVISFWEFLRWLNWLPL